MKHLVMMDLLRNITQTDSMSFTHTMKSSDIVVVWLIFAVALLLLVLKAVKYILKWKNKKLSTADTITELNSVLVEGMQLLSQRTTPSHTPSVHGGMA